MSLFQSMEHDSIKRNKDTIFIFAMSKLKRG